MPGDIAEIDAGGSAFTLQLLALVLSYLRSGSAVTIKNCTGADMLDMGMSLMANYERKRDGK